MCEDHDLDGITGKQGDCDGFFIFCIFVKNGISLSVTGWILSVNISSDLLFFRTRFLTACLILSQR